MCREASHTFSSSKVRMPRKYDPHLLSHVRGSVSPSNRGKFSFDGQYPLLRSSSDPSRLDLLLLLPVSCPDRLGACRFFGGIPSDVCWPSVLAMRSSCESRLELIVASWANNLSNFWESVKASGSSTVPDIVDAPAVKTDTNLMWCRRVGDLRGERSSRWAWELECRV